MAQVTTSKITIKELLNPQYFDQMYDLIGDFHTVQLGLKTTHLLNHPDFVKHVLVDNNQNYDKATPAFIFSRLVLGNGLFTSDGAFWLRQRRLAQPAFHRKQIDQLTATMNASIGGLMRRYAAYAEQQTPFDVGIEMTRVTLSIAGESLFSIDLDTDAPVVGEAVQALGRTFEDFVEHPVRTMLLIANRNNRQSVAAIFKLRKIVQRIIEKRRTEIGKHNDVLEMLIIARDEESGQAMTDKQLRDEVVTFMLAGHETTANMMTWAHYLLARHPQSMDRLAAEIDQQLKGRMPQIEDVHHLPYTYAVLSESLRLYPSAYMFSRRALKDDAIGGRLIKRGEIVIVPPFYVQRHPNFWPQPQKFDPERFIDRSEKRHRFAFMPFGGGPRQCIGNHFAMLEGVLTLVRIIQKYRLLPVNDNVIHPKMGATLRPERPVMMGVRARV